MTLKPQYIEYHFVALFYLLENGQSPEKKEDEEVKEEPIVDAEKEAVKEESDVKEIVNEDTAQNERPKSKSVSPAK